MNKPLWTPELEAFIRERLAAGDIASIASDSVIYAIDQVRAERDALRIENERLRKKVDAARDSLRAVIEVSRDREAFVMRRPERAAQLGLAALGENP